MDNALRSLNRAVLAIDKCAPLSTIALEENVIRNMIDWCKDFNQLASGLNKLERDGCEINHEVISRKVMSWERGLIYLMDQFEAI